jgi:hypothetical protein
MKVRDEKHVWAEDQSFAASCTNGDLGPTVKDAAPCTILHEGREADIRCVSHECLRCADSVIFKLSILKQVFTAKASTKLGQSTAVRTKKSVFGLMRWPKTLVASLGTLICLKRLQTDRSGEP